MPGYEKPYRLKAKIIYDCVLHIRDLGLKLLYQSKKGER